MYILSFETFDPSRYHTTPRLTVQGALALARLLLAACPDDPSPALLKLIKRLQAKVETLEQALITRRRELAGRTAAEEAALDLALDGLWLALRDALARWSVFEREGVKQLAARQTKDGFDWASRVAKAKDARELLARLFSVDGTAFLRSSYPEQAESMASILGLIEQDGLESLVTELAGSDLYQALRHAQLEYELMVEERGLRSGPLSDNFRVLRGELQRLIVRYASALIGSLDEDEPESLEIVAMALRPIDVMRAELSRGTIRSDMQAEEIVQELEQVLEQAADLPG